MEILQEKPRILVWGLSNNLAGTEAVINNYASNASDVAFDFLCYEKPERYGHLFSGTDNNCYVIPVKIKHPIKNWRALGRFAKEKRGCYSALWFNVNDISNIDLLKKAKAMGIPRRITHMHNSSYIDRLITRIFSALNRKKCLKLTTDRWACSESAGIFLYGDLPFTVIPNLVDAKGSAFSLQKRCEIRKQWALEDSFVIGTVGRVAEQKNQQFLVERLPDILKKQPNAMIVIVGDGPLRDSLLTLASHLGVSDHLVFTGAQKDIQGFLSSFDVFAFPSLYEGLSLSLLEAQYNGVPCVISEGVGIESIISEDVEVCPTNNGEEWVFKLLSAHRSSKPRLIKEKAEQYDLANAQAIAAKMFLA